VVSLVLFSTELYKSGLEGAIFLLLPPFRTKIAIDPPRAGLRALFVATNQLAEEF